MSKNFSPIQKNKGRLRVAWVSSFEKGGLGSSRFLQQQLQALEELGVSIEIKEYGALASLGNIRRAWVDLSNERNKFDLFHAQWGSGCGYLLSCIDAPKVMTLRGSDWYGSGGGSLKLSIREWLGSKLTRVAIKRYDRLVVVSQRMARETKTYQNDCQPVVIPTGINLQTFKAQNRERARKELGIKSGSGPVILFVTSAKDYPVKRQKLAYAAVERARQFDPSIQFIELTNKTDQELVKYYSAADRLLLTSAHEGWPNVVKEGLACNLPFISTDVSDLGLIAKQSAQCKVVEATPEALGEALLTSLAIKQIEPLRDFVTPMSLDLTAQKLRRVYEDVISNFYKG